MFSTHFSEILLTLLISVHNFYAAVLVGLLFIPSWGPGKNTLLSILCFRNQETLPGTFRKLPLASNWTKLGHTIIPEPTIVAGGILFQA